MREIERDREREREGEREREIERDVEEVNSPLHDFSELMTNIVFLRLLDTVGLDLSARKRK